MATGKITNVDDGYIQTFSKAYSQSTLSFDVEAISGNADSFCIDIRIADYLIGQLLYGLQSATITVNNMFGSIVFTANLVGSGSSVHVTVTASSSISGSKYCALLNHTYKQFRVKNIAWS